MFIPAFVILSDEDVSLHGVCPKMISHLLFDLDGTITDSRVGITRCIQYALSRIGQSPYNESEIKKFIGPPINSAFEKILGISNNNLIEQAVYFYRERFSEVGFRENRLYPGIIKLLTGLHNSSCKLYVVTNKPKVYADRIIRYLAIDRWFGEVFGPTLDEHLSNKNKLVSLALVNLKLPSQDTAVIGDRREDILAGKSNETITIGVTYGYGDKEEIIASEPHYICRHPLQILPVVINHRLLANQHSDYAIFNC